MADEIAEETPNGIHETHNRIVAIGNCIHPIEWKLFRLIVHKLLYHITCNDLT